MEDFIQKVLKEPFTDVFNRLVDFLPNLITSLIMLAVGLVAAWLLKLVVVRLLRVIKVDTLCDRTGVTPALLRGGIKEPMSSLVGRFVYIITVIGVVIIALDALKIPAVKEFLEKFFLYLPNVFAAVVVVVLGYIIGNFVGRATLIAAVNAGIKISGLISRLVKLSIYLLTASMALELLGIGKDTILIAFAVIFGGVVLALSLAFGLAGKDLARKFLEQKFKGDVEGGGDDDIKHI